MGLIIQRGFGTQPFDLFDFAQGFSCASTKLADFGAGAFALLEFVNDLAALFLLGLVGFNFLAAVRANQLPFFLRFLFLDHFAYHIPIITGRAS